MADDLSALGINVQDESSLRTGVEAQVAVDADPRTMEEARKLQEATRAVHKLEEDFDAVCDALADADGAIADAAGDAEARKKAVAQKLELQKRKTHLERRVAEGSKAVQRMAAAHRQARAARMQRIAEQQRAEAEAERRARQAEEQARLDATRAEQDGSEAPSADGSRPHQAHNSHAAGRLLNGAVSAGSRTLLSAKRAQRVLDTRIDRSHIDPRALAPGATATRGRADEAATTEAVRDYRGGSTVLESALRVTVSGGRRRDRRGDIVDDGDVERFNARRREAAERKERIARRREDRSQQQPPVAAENTRRQPRLIDEEVSGADNDDAADDDDANYVARLAARAMREADLGAEASDEGLSADESDDGDSDESEDMADIQVLGSLTIPAKVWVNLLDYQQVGVRWLLEKHHRRIGGILGDEMGLGKTIQIAAMLSALHNSNELRRPVLVLCPLTVIKQWVAELRKWVPALRTVVLHSSGSSNATRHELLTQVSGTACVVLSTYQTTVIEIDNIVACNPQYVILDEGHKICNPDASITIAVKTIPTPHRIILSGSPIQNTLKELWCLFDFVAPGTLGTVGTFVNEFEEPIKRSRNPSATTMEVQMAIECAKALRDHIAPYMLRRLKREVNTMLPPKHEKVVRCLLTDAQLQEYLNVLNSSEVRDFQRRVGNLRANLGSMDRNGRMYSTGGLQSHSDILGRGMTEGLARQAFKALSDLRAITNHADLFRVKADHHAEGGERGYVSFRSNNPVDLEASGKLKALDLLLTQWKAAGHRVLVFSQTRTALDIIENLVEQRGHTYFRMDGTTPSHHRQPLIDRFNNDPNVFVALLTTRVGGLGVNLVGADRVVIFDPDWNPVTDEQARERAWRIGQTREVCIYRMVTSGTVEEHILHRQLAKLFVAEKVLSDPTLQRSFHLASMAEAFMLGPEYASRVDPSSQGFVTLDSFNVSEEVRRGQEMLDEHGNTLGDGAEKKEEEDEDDKKPLVRRMVLTNGGVTVTGPSANRGTTARLAALEGGGTPAHGQSRTRQGSAATSMPQRQASAVGVVKTEPQDSEDAAVVRQSTQQARTGGADNDADPPGLIIEELAQEGRNSSQTDGAAASQSASVDPNAETGVLQGLLSGTVEDVADANGLAARLARIAAHRTLHRATSGLTRGGSRGLSRNPTQAQSQSQTPSAAGGRQGRQPLLPASLQPPAGAGSQPTRRRSATQ